MRPKIKSGERPSVKTKAAFRRPYMAIPVHSTPRFYPDVNSGLRRLLATIFLFLFLLALATHEADSVGREAFVHVHFL
jgi:hypothetical protein